MRYERQPIDQIKLTLEIAVVGAGQTGLAATTLFVLQRLSDGLYWDDNLTSWQPATPGTNQLIEVDAVRFPGLYEYDLPLAGVSLADAEDGYRFLVSESTTPVLSMGTIAVEQPKGGPWRTLALRQSNVRFVPSAWDPVTRQPTAGEVLVYATKAALLGDTGPGWVAAVGRYTVGATFDGSGLLTEYTSVVDV